MVSPPPIQVRIQQANASEEVRRFLEPFRVGRSHECQLQIRDRAVSKVHAELKFESGKWWIRDLDSANGTYLDDRRISLEPLPATGKIELGLGGPVLWLTIGDREESHQAARPQSPAREDHSSVTQIIQHYLTPSRPEGGEHTMLVRQAFDRVTKQRSKQYKAVIGVVAFLLVGAVGLAFYQSYKLQSLRSTASEIFYSMKQMELQLAQLEEIVLQSANARQAAEILAKRHEIKEMARRYDKFVEELGLYEDLSEEGRAIFRVARRFGECEAAMPKGFMKEVKKYIKKWKSTPRLAASLRRAKQKGYIQVVEKAMKEHNLPPQFLYLALQESSFNPRAVGPKTRYGYAKGIWQFIPATAKDYGLRVGPLKNRPRYDPKDERFHFHKATKAAARYIQRLYRTEAQASGLLVMASYNWGQGNVIQMIRQMPKNPRERNFWQLLKRFKIPKETYNYVFYIIAAAVISENPQLFGFDFPAPL